MEELVADFREEHRRQTALCSGHSTGRVYAGAGVAKAAVTREGT